MLFNRTRVFSFLSTLLFLPSLLLSQASSVENLKKGASEAGLPAVISGSPENALLSRLVSENMDKYTGLLNVNIPIYNFKSRSIEVPISLQTTANAPKVDELGGWAGFGWYLNAGGAITRVMKNMPDEYSVTQANPTAPLQTFNRTISSTFNFNGYGYLSLLNRNVDLDRFNLHGTGGNTYTVEEKREIIKRGAWNTSNSHPDVGYDLEPDEFTFSFGPYSGKFVFTATGELRIISDANISITPTITNGKITNFIVKTDDGYQYEFGGYALNAVEDTKLKTNSKSIQYSYLYVGYLDNLQVTLKEINGFSQQSGYTRVHFYERAPKILTTEGLVGQNCSTGPCIYEPGELLDFWHAHNNNESEYFEYPSTWYLTKITSPLSDVVNFLYTNNGAQSYITSRNIIGNSPSNIPVSTFPSGYTSFDVFASTNPPVPCLGLSNEYGQYPTFGSTTISANRITVQSKKLSEINSSQGYKVNFIATTSRLDLITDKLLNKIQVTYNDQLIKEFDFGYETAYNSESSEVVSATLKAPVRYFAPGSGTYLGTDFNRTVNSSETGAYLDNTERYRHFLSSIIEGGQNNEKIPAYQFTYFDKNELPFRTSLSQDRYGFSKNANDVNQPVLSKLFAGVLKSIKYPTGGTKEFEYSFSGNNEVWNGLKVDRIIERENNLANGIVTHYSYGTYVPTDNAASLYSLPDGVFSLVINSETKHFVASEKNFGSQARSTRFNPPSLSRGVGGGYSYIEVAKEGNGKHRTEFITSQQYPDLSNSTMLVSSLSGGFEANLSSGGYPYPFPPLTNNDWKRGQPSAEYFIDSKGKKIKSIHYEYSISNSHNGIGEKPIYGLITTKYRIKYGGDWDWSVYGRYNYTHGRVLPSLTTVKFYSENQDVVSESIVLNQYEKTTLNNKEYIFLQETKTSDLNQQFDYKVFKYPHQYTTSTDDFGQGITNLKNKGVLNAVIETYEYKAMTNASARLYFNGGINKYKTDLPVVDQVYTFQPRSSVYSFTPSSIIGNMFKFDENYKPVIKFNEYTLLGNPRSMQKEGDTKQVFLWDYNDTYPVAKIMNVDDAGAVAYSSFEADSKGGWNYDQAKVIADEGVTGQKIYELSSSGISKYVTPLLPQPPALAYDKKYLLAFWVKGSVPNVITTQPDPGGGSTIIMNAATVPKRVKGEWKYFEVIIQNAVQVNISMASPQSPAAFIDELRLHPINAQMSTITYKPLVGITSETDLNGRTVYYEYDNLGRLHIVKDDNGNILKTTQYNYKQ